ncbi:Uu.00g041860.m01.CDS01 [Anthostomella pinea]|uniref:Uu.00g041860.m01.CDS01 n=1 Tax=Anthostomella pinea TaxID=933095 RepID=A0AAI8YE73_9PEZI|nr:Uu.00g041860.m01.CDS01 [Anthostomella pinea]
MFRLPVVARRVAKTLCASNVNRIVAAKHLSTTAVKTPKQSATPPSQAEETTNNTPTAPTTPKTHTPTPIVLLSLPATEEDTLGLSLRHWHQGQYATALDEQLRGLSSPAQSLSVLRREESALSARLDKMRTTKRGHVGFDGDVCAIEHIVLGRREVLEARIVEMRAYEDGLKAYEDELKAYEDAVKAIAGVRLFGGFWL